MAQDPAKTTETREGKLQVLERARRAFGAALVDYQKAGGYYIDRAPELPQELISDCRFIANRYDLLKHLPRHGVVAEVGTDLGDFAARILEVCEPRELHVFELDVSRINPKNLDGPIASGRCKLHEGDSFAGLEKMPDDFFDWIYIDGDHSYEGVKRDIAGAVPRLKRGGYLVFNDYAVWSPASMSRCGVARAVNEFAKCEGWKLKYLAFQVTMYLDVVLVKPGDTG